MHLIKTLIDIIDFILSIIWQFVVAFGDWFGIGDFIQSKLLFWLILIALSTCGIYVSTKNKKKLWVVISSLSDIALLFGSMLSFKKSK